MLDLDKIEARANFLLHQEEGEIGFIHTNSLQHILKLVGEVRKRTPTYEMMHEGMHKIHIGDGSVFHIFNALDGGDPHDHPWSFRSDIIFGGYDEIIYDWKTGQETLVHRRPGDSFEVKPNHIHKIVHLPAGLAITRIWPEEKVQEPGFWKWDDFGALRKAHNEPGFTRVTLGD